MENLDIGQTVTSLKYRGSSLLHKRNCYPRWLNTKGLDIQQDFVACIVLVTMVPRCQTLQKSFLDTFQVIAVNH